jgi:hypothetical protein
MNSLAHDGDGPVPSADLGFGDEFHHLYQCTSGWATTSPPLCQVELGHHKTIILRGRLDLHTRREREREREREGEREREIAQIEGVEGVEGVTQPQPASIESSSALKLVGDICFLHLMSLYQMHFSCLVTSPVMCST